MTGDYLTGIVVGEDVGGSANTFVLVDGVWASTSTLRLPPSTFPVVLWILARDVL